MSPANNPLLRSLLGLWRGNNSFLPVVPTGTNDADGNPEAAPVSADNPLPVTVVGSGGGGTVAFPKVTATYAPQSLQVGTPQAQLTAPAGATDATVQVIFGSVRRSIGADAGAGSPLLGAGDSETISGAELAAYRMIREGGNDAQIVVEYRKVN